MPSIGPFTARAGALLLLALTPAGVASGQGPAEAPAERLPGGDSAEWRDRLTAWSHAPDPQPQVVEHVSTARARPLAISSAFGWRHDPLRGGSRRHEGVDLPGLLGSGVYSTGAGVVTFAGWAGGYGNMIQIDHSGGLRTRYGHLSRILVVRGSSVAHGERIGLMGSTGRSTGSHLHYEVRLAGAPLNPLGFIGGDSVPRYDVAWPAATKVTPRWAGWESATDFSALPEATIR